MRKIYQRQPSHKLGPCFKHADLTTKSRKPTIICQRLHGEMDSNHLYSCCSSLCCNHKVLLSSSMKNKPGTISAQTRLNCAKISDKSFQRAQVQTQTCRKTSSMCLHQNRNHKNPTLLPSTLPAADSVSRETKQHAHSTADFILAARGLPFIPHRYIYCPG